MRGKFISNVSSAVRIYGSLLMQTKDDERADRVIRFAEETLPLKEIASGPTEAPGFGPQFRQHMALDIVLQELRRFPGKGWTLIQAGLQSPTVRNRNMAIQALAAWERGGPGRLKLNSY